LRKRDEKNVMRASGARGNPQEVPPGTPADSGQLGLEESGFGERERSALDHLFSATYEELRRLASSVRRGDPSATLNPTALVNEAWIKMAKSPEIAATSQLHFKRIAARAMRQILIEAARRRNAGKRGGGQDVTVSFDDSYQKAPSCGEDLLRLDRALDELARMNPRQATLVESRFFGGLDIPETATLLSVSEATVLRDWRAAKAWLALQLREGE
jgi:RNA polymerase sigma factor (TIGR02999 family)